MPCCLYVYIWFMGRLVVSVTSYGVRLNTTLPLALRSVVGLSDMVVLYVSESDYGLLDVGLLPFGVDVRVVDDLKSFKKYGALCDREFDGDTVLVVDDDVCMNGDCVSVYERCTVSADVYAYRVKRVESLDFGRNKWVVGDCLVKPNYLIYTGMGTFFKPYVCRVGSEWLVDGRTVSPTCDDTYLSAYLMKNGLTVANIGYSGMNYRPIGLPAGAKTLYEVYNRYAMSEHYLNNLKHFGLCFIRS